MTERVEKSNDEQEVATGSEGNVKQNDNYKTNNFGRSVEKISNHDGIQSQTPQNNDTRFYITKKFSENDEKLAISQTQLPSISSQQTIFNECFVCKQNFVNFTVEQRESHINHCLDQQASEDYLKKKGFVDAENIANLKLTQSVTCCVCHKDITFYSETRRTQHVERCCEKESDQSTNNKKSRKATVIIKSNRPPKKKEHVKDDNSVVLDDKNEDQNSQHSETNDEKISPDQPSYMCFVCKKDIITLGVRARIKHLKLCAKLHNIKQNDIKKMLEMQKEQHKMNANKEKHAPKKKRKRKIEDETIEDKSSKIQANGKNKFIVHEDDGDSDFKKSDDDNNADKPKEINPFDMFRFDKSTITVATSSRSSNTALEQVSTVPEWLTLLEMDQYIDSFIQNGFDTLDICTEIEQEDLTFISKAGHRKHILLAAKQLKQVIILRGKRELRRQQLEVEMQRRKNEKQKRESARAKQLLERQKMHKQAEIDLAPLLQIEFRKSNEEIANQLRSELRDVAKIVPEEDNCGYADALENTINDNVASQPMSKSKFAPSTCRNPSSLLSLAKLSTPPRMSQLVSGPTFILKKDQLAEERRTSPDDVIPNLGEEEAQIVALGSEDWISQKLQSEQQLENGDLISPCNATPLRSNGPDISVISISSDTTSIQLQLNESGFIEGDPSTSISTADACCNDKGDDNFVELDLSSVLRSQFTICNEKELQQERQNSNEDRSRSPELFEDNDDTRDSFEEEIMIKKKRKNDVHDSSEELVIDEYSMDTHDINASESQQSKIKDHVLVSLPHNSEEHVRVENLDDKGKYTTNVSAEKIQDCYMEDCHELVTNFCEHVQSMYEELQLKINALTEKRDLAIKRTEDRSLLTNFKVDELKSLLNDWRTANKEDWDTNMDYCSPGATACEQDHDRVDDILHVPFDVDHYSDAYNTQVEDNQPQINHVDSDLETDDQVQNILLTQESSPLKVRKLNLQLGEERSFGQQTIVEIITDQSNTSGEEEKEQNEIVREKKKSKKSVRKLNSTGANKKRKKKTLPKEDSEEYESQTDDRVLSDSDSETRIINWKKKHELEDKLVNTAMQTNSNSSQSRKRLRLNKNTNVEESNDEERSSQPSKNNRVRNHKASGSCASQKSSTEENIPDFDSMSTQQLKTLLSQYGVKSGTKKFMVDKLQQIHKAIQQF